MERAILDGYNLLLRRGRDTSEGARQGLLREAALYASGRGVEVLVVFDARQGSGTSSTTPYAGVRVEFARGSADDAVLAIVRQSPRPGELLVVSGDRALCAAAHALGARIAETLPSASRPRRRGKASAPASDKPAGLSAREVEEWLAIFAEREPPEDEP